MLRFWSQSRLYKIPLRLRLQQKKPNCGSTIPAPTPAPQPWIQLNPLKYTIIKLLWQIQFKLVTCSVHLKLHNSSKSLHDSEVLTNPQQDIPGCGRDSWRQDRKTEHLSENSSGCTEAGQSHKVMMVRYKRMTNCYLHISAAMENVPV